MIIVKGIVPRGAIAIVESEAAHGLGMSSCAGVTMSAPSTVTWANTASFNVNVNTYHAWLYYLVSICLSLVALTKGMAAGSNKAVACEGTKYCVCFEGYHSKSPG